MYNYLFETCRGYFNWNKLVRKSVHVDGLSHVYYKTIEVLCHQQRRKDKTKEAANWAT